MVRTKQTARKLEKDEKSSREIDSDDGEYVDGDDNGSSSSSGSSSSDDDSPKATIVDAEDIPRPAAAASGGRAPMTLEQARAIRIAKTDVAKKTAKAKRKAEKDENATPKKKSKKQIIAEAKKFDCIECGLTVAKLSDLITCTVFIIGGGGLCQPCYNVRLVRDICDLCPCVTFVEALVGMRAECKAHNGHAMRCKKCLVANPILKKKLPVNCAQCKSAENDSTLYDDNLTPRVRKPIPSAVPDVKFDSTLTCGYCLSDPVFARCKHCGESVCKTCFSSCTTDACLSVGCVNCLSACGQCEASFCELCVLKCNGTDCDVRMCRPCVVNEDSTFDHDTDYFCLDCKVDQEELCVCTSCERMMRPDCVFACVKCKDTQCVDCIKVCYNDCGTALCSECAKEHPDFKKNGKFSCPECLAELAESEKIAAHNKKVFAETAAAKAAAKVAKAAKKPATKKVAAAAAPAAALIDFGGAAPVMVCTTFEIGTRKAKASVPLVNGKPMIEFSLL